MHGGNKSAAVLVTIQRFDGSSLVKQNVDSFDVAFSNGPVEWMSLISICCGTVYVHIGETWIVW